VQNYPSQIEYPIEKSHEQQKTDGKFQETTHTQFDEESIDFVIFVSIRL
jgi:hypothetical protein